jgi:hypothetical protein
LISFLVPFLSLQKFGNDLVDMSPKTQTTKTKIYECDIGFESVCETKGVNQQSDQAIYGMGGNV